MGSIKFRHWIGINDSWYAPPFGLVPRLGSKGMLNGYIPSEQVFRGFRCIASYVPEAPGSLIAGRCPPFGSCSNVIRPAGHHLPEPGSLERLRTYLGMHKATQNCQLQEYGDLTCPYFRAGALENAVDFENAVERQQGDAVATTASRWCHRHTRKCHYVAEAKALSKLTLWVEIVLFRFSPTGLNSQTS